MICLHKVISHVWYESFAWVLLPTEKSLLVLATSNGGSTTLIWNICHTWCSTYMWVLATTSWSFSERLSIVCWNSKLISYILSTLVYLWINQTSTSSCILMGFIMQVFIFVMNKRLIGILFLKSWIDLNWILCTWLRYLLSLTNWVSILLSIILGVYSSMRFHSLILHLILNLIWSCVRLRRSSLNITVLNSTRATNCDFLISFELISRWYNCLRGIHCLSLWIS